MEIILSDKLFIAPSPKARMVRRAIEISSSVDFNNITPENLDKLVLFVCELFDNQFTLDDIYDGLEAAALMPTLAGCISGVVNATSDKLNEFPKNVRAGK